MEKIGYILLGTVAIIWLIGIMTGIVVSFPFGIIGLIAILGVGFLMIKVIKDRMNSPEDDHYEKNIEK